MSQPQGRSFRSATVQSLIDPLDSSRQLSSSLIEEKPLNDSLSNNYTLDSDTGEQTTQANPELKLQVDETLDVSHRNSTKSLTALVLEFQKKKPIIMISVVYLKIFTVFLSVLSIYWGSFYKRTDRLKDLKYLIVNEDETVQGVPPYLGQSVNNTLSTHKEMGHWIIYNSTEFSNLLTSNNTVEQEFYRRVHHQEYWGGIWIKPNSTYQLYQSMINTTPINETLVDCIYESGRSLLGMQMYIIPNLRALQLHILNDTSQVFQSIYNQLSTTQKLHLVQQSPQILSSRSFFSMIDNRPITVTALTGPSTMGLVYCLVLSFHQFNFADRIHTKLILRLKRKDFMFIRLISSQLTFIFLSFLYCLMTLAYQVPTTTTFGKSGFLVLWSTIYLYFSAIGGLNENVALFIIARNRVYIGMWIVFCMVINISTTFYPLLLCPKFYRFGYLLPMHSANDLLSVIFFNVTKNHMGRSYGILIAWIILMNILLPFSIKANHNHILAKTTN